jgi:putative DNA primase/helicase
MMLASSDPANEHAAGERIASALPSTSRPSPSPGQRSVNLATRAAAALREALPKLCAEVRDAPDGAQNATLNANALRAFRLTLAAGSSLDETAEAFIAAGLDGNHPETRTRETVASARTAAEAQGPAELRERERPQKAPKPRTRKPVEAREGEASDAGEAWAPRREGLPVVTMSTVIADVEDAAIASLARCEALYQRHPQGIVRTIEAPAIDANATPAERSRAPEPGAPVIEACTAPFLRSHLSRVAVWRSWDNRKEGWREVPPPEWAASAILSRRTYPRSALRPLRGVIEAPALRPDGSVLTAPGYDPTTELLLHWNGAPVDVPDAPTREDARASFDALAGLFTDFVFQGDRGVQLAACIAAILTPLARAAVRGAVPAFMWEANGPGAGKTLCASVCGAIVTGRPPAVRSYTTDDDEMRKTLGAIALTSPPVALFDNVREHIEGGALESAITSADTIAPRVLGASAAPELPWRVVLYLTANGVTYSADNIERFVHITLAKAEGERPPFELPELLRHASERRAELLRHALVILRAHVAAGRPAAGSVHARFPEWSRAVAAPIAWCSGHDPVAAKPPASTSRDGEAARSLVVAWRFALGAESVTVAVLLARAKNTSPGAAGPRQTTAFVELAASLAELAGAPDLARVTARSVGRHLARVTGKPFVLRGGDVATLRASENRDGIKVYGLDVRAPDVAPIPPTAGQLEGEGAGFAGFGGVCGGEFGPIMPEHRGAPEATAEGEVFDA